MCVFSLILKRLFLKKKHQPRAIDKKPLNGVPWWRTPGANPPQRSTAHKHAIKSGVSGHTTVFLMENSALYRNRCVCVSPNCVCAVRYVYVTS